MKTQTQTAFVLIAMLLIITNFSSITNASSFAPFKHTLGYYTPTGKLKGVLWIRADYSLDYKDFGVYKQVGTRAMRIGGFGLVTKNGPVNVLNAYPFYIAIKNAGNVLKPGTYKFFFPYNCTTIPSNLLAWHQEGLKIVVIWNYS